MKTINKVLWKSASCKRKHWILNETLNNLIVLIKYYLFAKSFWIKLSVQMFVLYFSYFRFLNHKDNSGSLGRSEKAIRKYFVDLKFANKYLLSQALNTALQEWNIVRRTAWKPQTPQGRTFLENIQPNSLRSSWAAPEIKFRESHETIIILCHVWQVDRKGSKVNHHVYDIWTEKISQSTQKLSQSSEGQSAVHEKSFQPSKIFMLQLWFTSKVFPFSFSGANLTQAF